MLNNTCTLFNLDLLTDVNLHFLQPEAFLFYFRCKASALHLSEIELCFMLLKKETRKPSADEENEHKSNITHYLKSN